MLSRRNIRIKVMQMLYSMNRDKDLDYGHALLQYRESVRKSYDLYLFNLMQFVKVAQYSKKDAAAKLAKLLPSEEDKQFTAKLAENDLMRSITENEALWALFTKKGFAEEKEEDTIRLIYNEFSKTEAYKEYLKKADCSYEDHQKMLLTLYKHCSGNELFEELMEDEFPLWIDDKSLTIGAIKKTIKALPATDIFFKNFEPSDETVIEFGEALFKSVNESESELLELIEPTLKNWDVDRVAVVDMILLKMALCELMSFPTIPTKVTLNEFVEISKLYSTDKSKDFINGILDRLMKKLNKDGKINKEGRGLQE